MVSEKKNGNSNVWVWGLNFKAHAFQYYFGVNNEQAVGRPDSETG